MKIGILSDSHFTNPYRCDVPEWVAAAFADVDMIIHAGDVEHPDFLRALSSIAPIYAVRGNCDSHGFDTPEYMSIETGHGHITVAHRADVARRHLIPESKVMVYGHTHISLINQETDLLVINPGSITLPRGGLPASVALLTIDATGIDARLIKKP